MYGKAQKTPIKASPSKAVHAALQGGLTELQRRGHAKGRQLDRDTGGVCVQGAIRAAVHGRAQGPMRGTAREAELAFLELNGIASSAVPGWNDSPQRKPEEVVAAFERAAALSTPVPDCLPVGM